MSIARTIGLVALSALTIISFLPVITLVGSLSVASALGCQLDEGSVHPCYLGRVDLGEPLSIGMVLGWMMLITWPGMLVAMVAWLVILFRVLRWRRTGRP